MKEQIKEFYRELDLESGADLASVRQSYRQFVKVWHPDRFGHDQKLQTFANDKLKRINFAYEGLVAFFQNGGVGPFSPPPKTEAPPKATQATPGSDWLEEILKTPSKTSRPKAHQAAPGSNVYQAGLKRYQAKDYKGALGLFLQAAEIGNANAQYGLGYIYYRHRRFFPLIGASKHFAEILRWWTKAAEQGHTDAQYMVGIFHQIGWATPFDETEARKWFQRAAANGHLRAKERLSKLGIFNKINAIPLVRLFVGDTVPAPPRMT